MSEPKLPRAVAPPRFFRAFFRALTDEGTFDLRNNPTVWLGFVLAIPIPVLAFASGAPGWLILVSLPAPVAWAVILGAAGRVGILAQQEQDRMAHEIETARYEALAARENLQETEEALHEEAAKREALEEGQKLVLSELKLAQAVQSTLVPPNIHGPFCEVSVKHIPCSYVGGDYLHASVVGERWLYLCVGDVSGHGISAALVVARIHGVVRRLTLERHSPEGVLEALNRAALTIFKHTYFFLTFGIFRLDLTDGTLEYATAGHPGQVLLRRDGRLETLRTPNRLLGMDADIFDSERPSDRVRMEPGDMLVLFTDGLFEILGGSQGDVLGETGLRDRIASLGPLSPSLLAGEILQDMADFTGRSDFQDDVSLMVARYMATAPVPGSTTIPAAASPSAR